MKEGYLYAILLCVLLIFVFSCEKPSPSLRVITDRPDLLLFLEDFALRNPQIKLIVTESPDASLAVRDGTAAADVVVASSLTNGAVLEKLLPLSIFMDQGLLDAGQLIPESQQAARLDGKVHALVLAFDLPLFWGDSRLFSQEGDYFERMIMDEEVILSHLVKGSKRSRTKIETLCFSPLSNPKFLVSHAQNFGARLSAARSGIPQWDIASIQRANAWLTEWMLSSAGSQALERQFLETYSYLPRLHLLDSGRILSDFGTLSQYMNLPLNIRQKMKPILPAVRDKIQVGMDTISVGILNRTRNQKHAVLLLAALADRRNQQRYMERASELGANAFGFLGMLSTNALVYTQVFPTVYKDLAGILPPVTHLDFPVSVPTAWIQWEKEILNPFLLALLEENLDTQVLERKTEQWLLQQGIAKN